MPQIQRDLSRSSVGPPRRSPSRRPHRANWRLLCSARRPTALNRPDVRAEDGPRARLRSAETITTRSTSPPYKTTSRGRGRRTAPPPAQASRYSTLDLAVARHAHVADHNLVEALAARPAFRPSGFSADDPAPPQAPRSPTPGEISRTSKGGMRFGDGLRAAFRNNPSARTRPC